MSRRRTSIKNQGSDKTELNVMPDNVLLEIFSKTQNPKDLVKLCATNKQYAEFCNKNRERINKAQLIRNFPTLEKFMNEPITLLNMILYRRYDISKIANMGATRYLIEYIITPWNQWATNFEDISIMITMFDADPNEILIHIIRYEQMLNISVEQYKEYIKYVKMIKPSLVLDPVALIYFINNLDINYIKTLLPNYSSLSAEIIIRAFLNNITDVELLWSMLLLLDKSTVNNRYTINLVNNNTLGRVLLLSPYGIAANDSHSQQIRKARRERFLLQYLSYEPDMNQILEGTTFARLAFSTIVAPLLTDKVLIKVLNLNPDLTQDVLFNRNNETLQHIAFKNESISEEVYLELLKLKPNLNYVDSLNNTPVYNAFMNKNITEKVLLEILNQDIDLIIEGMGYDENLLIIGLDNQTGRFTTKVLLKLVEIGKPYMYNIDKYGRDAMYVAFSNKDISDEVLKYIIEINQPIDLNREYTLRIKQTNSRKTNRKTVTLKDIITQNNKDYLFIEEDKPSTSLRRSTRSTTKSKFSLSKEK